MDARDQALLIRNTLEKRGELRALILIERLEQRGLVASGRSAERLVHLAARLRNLKGMAAPVLRLDLALDQALVLEFIDQANDAIGQCAQRGRQLLLSHTRRRAQDPKNSGVRGG